MAVKGQVELYAFNRGRISRLGLARTDLKRTSLSADVMTNWMPRVLGSMMLRPGMGYIGSTLSNGVARLLPFVFSTSDTRRLEISDSFMRIWSGTQLVTRGTVTAAITNGAFTSNLTSWTDADEAGATSAWVTGGYMGLVGTGVNSAIRYQLVTVVEPGDLHALRIVVTTGPI